MTKRYDIAQTPYQRVLADARVSKKIKTALEAQYDQLNPAQLRRDLNALTDKLLKINQAKHEPARLPVRPPPAPRASGREATKRPSRAS